MENMGNTRPNVYCGTLRNENVGTTVTVGGYIAKCRDLGGIIFADLRDTSGILQLCFDEGTPKDVFEKAVQLHSEYVVLAEGIIRERSAKTDKFFPLRQLQAKNRKIALRGEKF